MNSQAVTSYAGVTYRQLDNWVRQGYVAAVGGQGTGSSRDFSFRQANKVLTMRKLIDAGFTPTKAAEISSMTFEQFEKFLDGLRTDMS